MRLTWRDRLEYNPFGTVAALTGVILGSLGIAVGDGVSQGMTQSLHDTASLVAHLWGVIFASGGALKLYGLYGGRMAAEIPGLSLLVGGYGFYSITVVAGLGYHGLAAGIISGALCIGCWLKLRVILRRVRRIEPR